MAESSAVRHIGPTVSRVQLTGITPRLLTRPFVGFRPTMPHTDAGARIEPVVSVPRAPKQSSAATATAAPPEEPDGTRSNAQGLCTGLKYVDADEPPIANS